MSDERALLAAIWESPHDDTVRLAYADWLDEQGGESHAARAELIRVQCALAALGGDDPRFDAHEARGRELTERWEKSWWKAMPAGARRGHFDRGFPVPSLAQLSIPGLVGLGEKRLRAAPLWRYHYGVHGRDLDRLLPWPFLHRLEMFALRPPLDPDWAARLAGCDNLRNVAALELIDCWVGAADLKLILDAFAGRHLDSLRFNPADEDALRVLADHPTAAGLRTLKFDQTQLGAAAVPVLTGSRQLTRLTCLKWGRSPLGDEGLRALLEWPRLAALRHLFVDETGVTDAGASALAACPAVANLRSLWLPDNPIGADGAAALAASPHLTDVARLCLYDTPALAIPTTGVTLRKRFGKKLIP